MYKGGAMPKKLTPEVISAIAKKHGWSDEWAKHVIIKVKEVTGARGTKAIVELLRDGVSLKGR